MKTSKWKNIYTYILKWSTIKIIFDGFIGKVILILSILSILLIIPTIKSSNSQSILFMSISILLFILGYIIYVISIPEIIRKYTRYDYVTSLLNRNKESMLNKITEFKVLEENNINYLPIYNDKVDNFKNVTNIQNFMNDTTSDSIYQLASIKYSYIDNDNIIIRILLSLILIMFFISFYYLSIEKLIIFILKGI